MKLIPVSGEPGFRWRGNEVTRLEGFSDAVFAFAVTLLVVSLEVPHTFHDLLRVMKGFPAFAICFAMLTQVWYDHSKFFRRFGLQNTFIVFVNCVLLFVVLFYVYPLKFLFTLLLNQISNGALITENTPHQSLVLTTSEARTLMVVYGLGFAAIFGLFAIMYLYALRQRASLDLNELEIHHTRHSLVENCGMAGIGLLSTMAALILPGDRVGAAGYVYFGIGVLMWVSGTVFRRRERRIRERMGSEIKSSS